MPISIGHAPFARWMVIAALGCSANQSPHQASPSGVSTSQPASIGRVDDCARAPLPDLAELWGRYTITAVEGYRGGLTSRASALERVGDEMLLSEGVLRHARRNVAAPQYSLTCHDDNRREGEVPTTADRSVSTFYGFGSEREVVWVLEVRGADSDRALFKFEVVPGENGLELWDTYDGWIYFMRRAADVE